ncbi:MAG: hypothetical protein P8M20_10205, partial [Planctomycetaceae bacterium]|nr:hypothetical protein [Planctomycetaceae bacterium]
MSQNFKTTLLSLALLSCLCDAESVVTAQDAKAESTSATRKKLPLDIGQQAVLSRFDRFEKELVQMAEQLRRADPERAELLFRTHSKSQQERVIGQMRMIHELLADKNPQFGDSIQRQEGLVASLVTLLDLLQSENRISEIEAERARVKAILKNVNKIIGKEKDVRANTERGSDPSKSASDQEGVVKDADELINKIKQHDAKKEAERESNKPPSENNSAKPEGENTEPKDPSSPKDGDAEPKDPKSGDPKDGETKPAEPKDGKPKDGEPSKGEPKDGQPKDGQPESGEPNNQPQTPGREDLEEARQEMEKAIQELKEKKDRGKASRHQDEAIRQLLEAKEKLEEILRQLREEEKSLTLASLESRFRKMLSMQLLVYQETLRLDKESEDQSDNPSARGRQLATQEEEILQEVDKALVVLREEGSSVAFPEAVQAIREDAASIVELLDQGKAGELTQTLEQAVIEAIEEMVDALQKEMEKKKDEEQKQSPQQQGQPQDKPLVDALSELKMLR